MSKIIGIAPVSGGAFPSQLAIYSHLIQNEIFCDILLASSGGNIATYIASASDWNIDGIRRIIKKLSSRDIFKPWVPIFNSIVGFFYGSIYQSGDGFKKVLHECFTSDTIVNDEIWTGIYNRERQRPRFMCNRSREDSVFRDCTVDENLSYCMELTYLNGNIDDIAISSQASASIPTLIEPQIIEGESYCDGGLSFSSPLQGFESMIIDMYMSFHLIYINSMDLQQSINANTYQNILDNGRLAASELVRGHLIADRLCAYRMLSARSHRAHIKPNFALLDISELPIIKMVQNQTERSLLELYPETYEEIDIIDFEGKDIEELLNKAYKCIKCRFWWIGDPMLLEENRKLYEKQEKEIQIYWKDGY